jgi:small-conductance mechanosensitive channel
MSHYLDVFFKEWGINKESLLPLLLEILIIAGAAAIAWWIFNLCVSRFRKRYQDRPFFQKGSRIFPLTKKAGHTTILILTGVVLLNTFKAPLVERVFYALMIMLLASFSDSLIRIIIPILEEKLASKTESRIDDVILGLLKKFASVVIYITGAILALDTLGINIMPFIAGAGVAGIAIGFAAKDTLSNVIAGILLIIDRPFEVGDRIEVWSAPKDSATWGDIVDIGLRATRIRTTDNIVIVIPNNEIMKRDIINYTAMEDPIRVRIPIGIAYDADVNSAKEIIKNVALELEWVMEDPEPVTVVKSFGDSAVNLEARIWIQNPRKRIHTISHLTDRVKEMFSREGIEIPYPKREIYIKSSATDPEVS